MCVQVPEEPICTTAHIRRYVAHWALTDRKLYLVGVEGSSLLKATGSVFADRVNEDIHLEN